MSDQIVLATFKTSTGREIEVEVIGNHPVRKDAKLVRTLDGSMPWTISGLGWFDSSNQTYVFNGALSNVRVEEREDYDPFELEAAQEEAARDECYDPWQDYVDGALGTLGRN